MNARLTPLGLLTVIATGQAIPTRVVHAQMPPTETLTAARETGGAANFTKRDYVTLGALLVGVAAIVPLDESFAQQIRGAQPQGNAAFQHASGVFRTLGDPGAIVLTSGLYALGRVSGRPALADLGLHATEAIVVSGAATGALKFLIGRARPTLASATDPGEFGEETEEFRPARGLGGYTSFPSGHTTVAFAAASAISAELRLSNPGAARIATPLLFGSATAVGLSRMYDNKHWASDVAMAALVGTLVGRKVVAYQHANPGNRLDRWLLPTSIRPSGSGATIGWSLTVR